MVTSCLPSLNEDIFVVVVIYIPDDNVSPPLKRNDVHFHDSQTCSFVSIQGEMVIKEGGFIVGTQGIGCDRRNPNSN